MLLLKELLNHFGNYRINHKKVQKIKVEQRWLKIAQLQNISGKNDDLQKQKGYAHSIAH